MTLPQSFATFPDPMDPDDTTDFLINTSSSLDAAETVASYTLTVSAEMVALGISIPDTGDYAHGLLTGADATAAEVRDDTAIRIWPAVDPAYQANAAFDGAGTVFGITLDFTTNALPPRTMERTIGIRIIQR